MRRTDAPIPLSWFAATVTLPWTLTGDTWHSRYKRIYLHYYKVTANFIRKGI